MVLPEPETLINLSMLSVLQNESKWENSVYDQSCQNVCVWCGVCVCMCVSLHLLRKRVKGLGKWMYNQPTQS